MAWSSHLFKNFPQFAVIHTVKDFGIVNKAEVDVFLELSCFFPLPYISLDTKNNLRQRSQLKVNFYVLSSTLQVQRLT